MEKNIQNPPQSTTNCKIIWTESDLDRLSKAIVFCYKNATEKFGSELELEARISGFKFVLQSDFTMEQVLSAFKTFMKKSTKMIAPADVFRILQPEKPKITQAEYIAALDYQKRNNYPSHSFEAKIIKEYTAQLGEDAPTLRIEGAKLPIYLNKKTLPSQSEYGEKDDFEKIDWNSLSEDEKNARGDICRSLKPAIKKQYLASFKNYPKELESDSSHA